MSLLVAYNPQANYQALSEMTRALIGAALAPNTQRAYQAQWRLWVANAAASGITALPAAPTDVANWLAHRHASDGAAIATLRSAVAALRMAHQAAGLAFDTRDSVLALTLRGAQRRSGQHQPQAAPLRALSVADILSHLGTAIRDLRDGAAIALGYCFARRRTELTGLDYGRLGRGDGWLQVNERTLDLYLVRSKGGGADGAEVYVVPRKPNRLAVAAIERWVTAAAIAPGTPLLRRLYKSGGISEDRLDPQSVSLILKARLAEHFERQGQDPADARELARAYSGHSLRVGFAVTAAEAGASIVAIQKALGHRSPLMAARYARQSDLARLSPHLLEGVAPQRSPRRRKRTTEGQP